MKECELNTTQQNASCPLKLIDQSQQKCHLEVI